MRKRSAQDLDGNLTVEPRIEGAPDFAHPACAQWGEDFICAKMLARPKCHFFNSTIQLRITLTGVGSPTCVPIKNRCPSAVTSYSIPV